MDKKQISIFAALVGVFLFAYYVNFTSEKIQNALMEAFYMLQWYVRYHTLACVVPAMFIAGAIATFFSKEAVLRHLGPKANKIESYAVASTSGTVLAVCSCSVLPMFAGIYRVGAGLGSTLDACWCRLVHRRLPAAHAADAIGDGGWTQKRRAGSCPTSASSRLGARNARLMQGSIAAPRS